MMEEKRICAFIDILGFKNEILKNDAQRRAKIINLIKKISNDDIEQGMHTENFGPASMSYPSAEVTSFSDNIVISSNLIPIKRQYKLGLEIKEIFEEPAMIVEHIFIKIIAVYWEALHMGLLFRGGITVGRLYHKDRVVVGEALINSYELEKETFYPRIEVTKEVVDIVKNMDKIRDLDTLFVEKEGKYFVNVFTFNIGVWRDYAHYNSMEELEYKTIIEIVDNIILNAKNNYKKYSNIKDDKVASKWKWFLDNFLEEYDKGYWLKIREAVKKQNIHK